MIRLPLFLITLALLSACGADGAPTPPATGITISGSAEMGVAKNGS